MKNSKLYICIAAAVLILSMAVSFYAGYKYCQSQYSDYIVRDTITVKDTVTAYRPMPSDTIYIPVPAIVDTAAILADYFSQKVYVDTIPLDIYGSVTVIDTLYQNGIDNRQVEYSINIPTYTTNKKVHFLAGGFVWKDGAGVLGSIKYKKLMLSAGYDFVKKSPAAAIQYEF